MMLTRRLLLAFVLLPVLLAAQSPDPARPWPNHEQPPDGWFCVPARDTKAVETDAHACACRGMILDDPEPFCYVPGEDEEGNQITIPRGESNTCKVFCHKDHCRCSNRCKDS
jgi:hypothetical protein